MFITQSVLYIVHLCSEGNITVTGTFECINTDDKIYIVVKDSTLSVPSIELYNNNQVGQMKVHLDVEGAILARNSSAEIVNNGTLTAKIR